MVVDATGRAVCYLYGEDGPQGVNSDKLTVDEVRRLAFGIARLPELLGQVPK